MKLRKFSDYIAIFQKENLSGNDAVLVVVRDLFMCHHGDFLKDENWNDFIAKLSEEQKKKLIELVWFYYHLARPEETVGVREELRLIAITSVIEKLMSDIKFKTFTDWYRGKYKSNKIEDLDTAEKEYLEEFGSTKKFRTYFKNHLDETSQQTLINCISGLKDEKELSIDEIAKFFYTMRSEFVHEAIMQSFCSPSAVITAVKVGDKAYKTTLEIEHFMHIFEKSFVWYWINLTKEPKSE